MYAPLPLPAVARLGACLRTADVLPYSAACVAAACDLQPCSELVERAYDLPPYYDRRAQMANLCQVLLKELAAAHAVADVVVPDWLLGVPPAALPARVCAMVCTAQRVPQPSGDVLPMDEYCEQLRARKLLGQPPDLTSPYYTSLECLRAGGLLFDAHFRAALVRQLHHFKPGSYYWKLTEGMVGAVATRAARWEWVRRLASATAAAAARAAAAERTAEAEALVVEGGSGKGEGGGGAGSSSSSTGAGNNRPGVWRMAGTTAIMSLGQARGPRRQEPSAASGAATAAASRGGGGDAGLEAVVAAALSAPPSGDDDASRATAAAPLADAALADLLAAPPPPDDDAPPPPAGHRRRR